MNVAHLLIRQAELRPDAVAIIEKGRSITFAKLSQRSAQAAAMLRADGINAGDAVLVFVPMSIELYVALIALFRIGAVATFLDPSAGKDHIARCCAMLPPRAMIAISQAHWLRITTPPLRAIPRTYSVGWPVPGAKRWENVSRASIDTVIAERSDADPALITFTSGSTNQPKAAVRSHGFLALQHAALQRAIDLQPGQIDLTTLPIFTLVNIASGVTSLIPDADLRLPGSISAGPVLRQMRKHRPTRAVASPAFFERLLAHRDVGESTTSLRQVYTGGAPVFPLLFATLAMRAIHARVVALYGSTEAEPIAEIDFMSVSGADCDRMEAGGGLLAGAIVPEILLRIIRGRWDKKIGSITSANLDDLSCPTNEPGEIVVTGPHVLRGYLNGVGDEETKFRVDGTAWHRTGDAGYLDSTNRLWLLGRAQARIDDEHGTIYPFAVECAVSVIPEVRRSALVQHEGRRLLVYESDRDIEAELERRLSFAKLHELRRMTLIPVDKRHNAKIDYPALKERLRSERH